MAGGDRVEGWRTFARDVHGPDGRGDAADAGELWIADNALCFTGARTAWIVPLGWLSRPETGLDGVTRLRGRTADSLAPLSFRLTRPAEDERALIEAINIAQTQPPDTRDLRALDDLLRLIGPDLRTLDAEARRIESGETRDDGHAAYLDRLQATCTRLLALWLPFWGDPATRLRDATLGALRAAIDTLGPGANQDDRDRCARAIQLWLNVAEELQARCGVPLIGQLPPPRCPNPPLPRAAADRGAPATAATTPLAAAPGEAVVVVPASPTARRQAAEAVSSSTPVEQPPAPPQPQAAAPAVSPPGQAAAAAPAPPTSGIVPSSTAGAVPTDGLLSTSGMTRLLRRTAGNQVVARKVLLREYAARQAIESAFYQIGWRFSAVHHPNVVRVLSVGQSEGGLPGFDLEWIDGETLRARMQRGRLPRELALRILADLADAIDALHFSGVMHGDIRPDNVMLDRQGRVVLLEPTIAADPAVEEQRGEIFGDPAYMAPEHALGDVQVPRSDLYSLAVLAFALLAGREPFLGTPAEVFAATLDQKPPALSDLQPDVPTVASDLIAGALAKRPEERPASAIAFVAALRQLLLPNETGAAPGA